MSGMRKLALASAIAVLSGNAFGIELLQDETLRKVVGQAGMTIDIKSRIELGEHAYQDGGFLLYQGIRIGGNAIGNGTGSGSDYLDNLRLTVDVSGGGGSSGDNYLDYGFSFMRDIASMYEMAGNVDPLFAEIASGVDSRRGGLLVDQKRTYGDGDLVMHHGFTDGWANAGGFDQYVQDGRFISDSFETVEALLQQAVDFRREIDAVGLARSDYTIGSKGLDEDSNHATGQHEGAEGTTTLISQIGIQGYLGPHDTLIQNRGNGFDGTGPLGAGTGLGNSGIISSSYFQITDADYYLELEGIQFRDIQVHNKRGDRTGLDGTSSFDFAHSIHDTRAVKDAVLILDGNASQFSQAAYYTDGVSVHTLYKADVDIPHVSFGDTGQTVGAYYLTDLYSDTQHITSAH